MLSLYSRFLDKFPMLTKCITSGVLFSLGDVVTQKYIQKRSQFDWKRNVILFLTGSLYIAPVLHVWYCKMLPLIANRLLPQNDIAMTFGKMALDQVVFAPFVLSGFFIFLSTISQGDPMKGISQIKQKIRQTLVANWKIWPLAMIFNFYLMPLKYQVLFSNFVGFFWNIILSYIAHK